MSEMMIVEFEVPAEEVQVGDQIFPETSPYVSRYWRKIVRISRLGNDYEFWFLSEANLGLVLNMRSPGELVLVRRTEENETPL